MSKIEKTVFISYRRTDQPWAMLVYKDLKSRKYDVFFDYESIPSGDFEQIIVSSIKARAHFILILTPTALERCDNPGDWVRREIETAIEVKRNIVPLLFDDFNFGSPAVAEKLTGRLSTLSHYNGLEVPAAYFDDAMRKLRKQYLNRPLDAVLHPISTEIQIEVKKHQAAVDKALKSADFEATDRMLDSAKKKADDEFMKTLLAEEASYELVQIEPETMRNPVHEAVSESNTSLTPDPLVFYPIATLSLRTQPVVSPDTVIRRIPITEQLFSIEPVNDARKKVGVNNQWLKVRDTSGREGYVAAWYVKSAGDSTTGRTLDSTRETSAEKFKKTLGTLAEDASSDLVRQELEAMRNAPWDATETSRTGESHLLSILAEISEDYAHIEIGRDTTKETLNEILAQYPKTNDIKG